MYITVQLIVIKAHAVVHAAIRVAFCCDTHGQTLHFPLTGGMANLLGGGWCNGNHGNSLKGL